ncbi:MAG: HAMP domain-containing protein [Acidobacteria bacterium]|nr:HAMP domain-containing protein [Acidobacteriota bacterium]
MSQAEKRIKTDRLVLFGISALVVVLTAAYAFLQRSEDLSFKYVTNTVLLGFLGILDLVLIIGLVVVLTRNLAKLLLERRRDILGSRFRTKLVFSFIGLCLVPSVLLFVAAISLIERNVERWFNTPVDVIASQSQQIVQALYQEHRDRARKLAETLATVVGREKLLQGTQRRLLLGALQGKMREYRLDYASVYDAEGAGVVAANPLLSLDHLTPPPENLRERAMLGEPFEWIEDLGSGRLVRAGWPIRPAAGGEIVGVAIAGSYVGKEIAALTTSVSRASENYRQIKAQKGAIQQVYISVFVLITLLVIFGATWIGFYLAGQITVPIQMLAEGTRAVAGGDLDYRVSVRPGDELGILVDSFNAMTGELKGRREEAERAAAEIRTRNAEMEDRRRYIETLLESIPVGVVSLSAEGRVTTINRAARRILRIDPGLDVRLLRFGELFARGRLAEVGEAAGECLARKAPMFREIHSNVDGEPISLGVTVATVGEEPSPGVILVMEDVTRLIKAQKTAAWQEVARRIAHEIKNPLTPIQLSAQRILKKHREGGADFAAALEEGAATIVREVKTLKTLVNEFSGFARMPAVNPIPADLHEIIDAALGLYQGAYADVRFDREFSGDLPSARLDHEQMKRVFVNLIDNALEAMDRHGRIVIGTRYLRDQRLMRIEVADDGPGIPSEDKDKLFLPYFSTKRRGTGLGLAIVNRIVSDHNGYIRVEDNRPRGTRFVIELPAAS